MVEATCPAKRPAFEGRWFFLWACRGCNNAKRYDATLGPDHGSQRKARRFYQSPERPADPRRAVLPQHHRPVPLAVRQLRDFTVNLQASRGSPHPPSPGLRSRCSLAGALQPKQVAPHSRCSPPGPSQWLQPQMPSAALSPAAPQALTVAAASRASLLLFSPGVRTAGGEDRGAGATTTSG